MHHGFTRYGQTDEAVLDEDHAKVDGKDVAFTPGDNSKGYRCFMGEFRGYDELMSELASPCSRSPTNRPTSGPTIGPTSRPTSGPISGPTGRPTSGPASRPTSGPTSRSTSRPTSRPASGVTGESEYTNHLSESQEQYFIDNNIILPSMTGGVLSTSRPQAPSAVDTPEG